MKVGRALADLEHLLVSRLEETIADVIAIELGGKILEGQFALKVAAALLWIEPWRVKRDL